MGGYGSQLSPIIIASPPGQVFFGIDTLDRSGSLWGSKGDWREACQLLQWKALIGRFIAGAVH